METNLIKNNTPDLFHIKSFVPDNYGNIVKIEPFFFQQYFTSVADLETFFDITENNQVVYGQITIDSIISTTIYAARLFDPNNNNVCFVGSSPDYTQSFNPLFNFFSKAEFRFAATNITVTMKGYLITYNS